MDLSYDWGFGTNFLNGNISGNKWRSKGDGQQRAYGFGYDAVNRILFADFNQYSGSGWDKTAGLDFTTVMGNGLDAGTAYDENGNIRFMQQQGWQMGGSHLIDSLAYTYATSSNKLQNVIDGDNDPLTKLGDFRTSSLSPYNIGKTSSAVDYVYDDNGNLTRDLNKDIGSQTADGIAYNHLNLPWQVTIRSVTGTKGTITYIYDAAGNKLEKKVVDSAGGVQTLTTYIGGFQYQGRVGLAESTSADTLLFFAHEEGRVRVVPDTVAGHQPISFKYDYFLKDHLGNTRMVLTDEQESDKYMAATMELGDSASENLYYSGLDETRVSLPAGYPTDTTTNPNNYVARLNGGSSGPKIGPGIVLKVMAGDHFSIRSSSWYRLNGTSPGTPASPLTDLVTALIEGIGALPGGGHPSAGLMQANQAPISANFTQFLQDTGSAIVQGKPHAFVNWVLFDNQFNYVAGSSGFQQVGADQELKQHILLNLPVTESGYLYIYTSNETPNVDVFFDNLQVTHTRGPLLEEDHYYAFGLTMQGISDKTLKWNYKANKFRYNEMELQNAEFSDGSGLEIYDYGARIQDPQLGVWHGIDPHLEFYESVSPYSYCFNNPERYFDMSGTDPGDIVIFFTGANIGQFRTASTGWMMEKVSRFINGGHTERWRSTPFGEFYWNMNTQDAYTAIKKRKNEYSNSRVIIYGYSYGGQLANHLAKRLNKIGVKVDLLITVDAAAGTESNSVDRTISNNVALNVNFFEYLTPSLDPLPNHGAPNTADAANTTILNFDMTGQEFVDDDGKTEKVNHINIDEASKVATVNYIMAALPRIREERTKPLILEDVLSSWGIPYQFTGTQNQKMQGASNPPQFNHLYGVY